MGILDKLKAIFVLPEEQDRSVGSLNVPESSIADSGGNRESINAENRQKFFELLSNILEKNNQPGYDYLEFKKALQAVSKVSSMDEPGVFRTVYAAAQAMNIDSAHLLSTANSYLDLLEGEKAKFNQAADHYLSEQITTRKAEINSIDVRIDENHRKMEDLGKESELLARKKAALDEELDKIQSKVGQNKAGFNLQYESLTAEIREDIAKMRKYLL